jgi:GNAT superfamily N-acetyltransferase
MNIKVRKVGLSDLKALQRIGIDSYVPHYPHLWKPNGIEWYLERCFGDEFLQKELINPNVEYYIVESDAEAIGMMKLILKKPLPGSDIENTLYLEKIYFIKEWTGKGVGRKLIDLALSRAAELNRECIWLMAMDTSAKPIAAYEKSGFKLHCYTRLGDEFELLKEELRGMAVMKRCLEKNGN